MQSSQRLCRQALQRLPRQIQPVDAEMNVGVDEAGKNSTVAQIKDIRTAGSPDRARYFDNAIAFYQDFSRATHPVAQAVEQFSADDDGFRHVIFPLLELKLLMALGVRPPSIEASGARISRGLSN